MIRKYGRLWSIAAAFIIFIVILTTFNPFKEPAPATLLGEEEFKSEPPGHDVAKYGQEEETPPEDKGVVEPPTVDVPPLRPPPPPPDPPPPPPPADPPVPEPPDSPPLPPIPEGPPAAEPPDPPPLPPIPEGPPAAEPPDPPPLPPIPEGPPAAEAPGSPPPPEGEVIAPPDVTLTPATKIDDLPDTETSNGTATETVAEPKPTETTKILVMGRLQTEDTNWVGENLADWQNAIYYVDLPSNETSPSGLRTKMNKAREAMPYLTYIIDNYPKFPDINVFIHPHRTGMPAAWHNDARGHDAVNMIRDLKLETVLERGYVNLRCNNEVGCPDEIHPFRDPPLDDKDAEKAYPYVYAYFFNSSFEEMRQTIPVVATQCCAQFALSKQQLLKRPKSDYEKYRQFLEETHYDDATSGRVMEYMWHIIFGRDPVHCENVFECWCAVYGRCNGFGRRRHLYF